jgi:hypothetical protein
MAASHEWPGKALFARIVTNVYREDSGEDGNVRTL